MWMQLAGGPVFCSNMNSEWCE